MKIALIGNCQCESLRTCLAAMTDGLDIRSFMVHDVAADPVSLAEIFRTSDLLFAQTSVRAHVPPDHSPKVIYFPTIAFQAYHPDLTFVRGRKIGGETETVSNPLSGYHSLIATFGFAAGIGLEDILTFYHADVYSRLGYFDQWAPARAQLLAEGRDAGMPLAEMFAGWARGDAFMHSSNHPTLRVMEDVARELLRRAGIAPLSDSVHSIVADPLRAMPVWPIYPEIAARLGLHGNMIFKPHDAEKPLALRDFVARSYECLAGFDRQSLDPVTMPVAEVAKRLGFSGTRPAPPAAHNPYASAPRVQFWKNSVAAVEPTDLDPVVAPRFTIGPNDRVATAGSCFAQHIARTLKKSGFDYFVAEVAPPGMTEEEARDRNFGIFSARFGNIYTTRQLLQLIQRAEGEFSPRMRSWTAPGSDLLVDPFRPRIEPGGFVDEELLERSREEHFSAVRTMLREMDVFVFTLGLTEGWRARFDGAVFPLAPGVAGGRPDQDEFEFVNFSIDEVRSDLHAVVARLAAINPRCRIILTVSPVPLIATYEPQHALVATTYSKAVLRVAADEMRRTYDHVEYFPSFEIITGSFNRGRYFEDDLREVTPEGVAHVMKVFMHHYAGEASASVSTNSARPKAVRRNAFFDIVCDEEAIAKF